MALTATKLNVHTRETFVRKTVKEIDITKQILNTVFAYYPKECMCIAGYLDNSDQFWKVNYHWDLLVSKIDELLAIKDLDARFFKAGTAIKTALMSNHPIPVTGYRLDKQVNQTKDSSSSERIIARHAILKQSKKDFETVIIKAEIVDADTKSNPPKEEKMWWLAVAPLAVPGTSKHGTGYALDIAGNNDETKKISNSLGASLVFNEASHVHVEFSNWKNMIIELS